MTVSDQSGDVWSVQYSLYAEGSAVCSYGLSLYWNLRAASAATAVP